LLSGLVGDIGLSRRVKRRWALRARNPPRDNPAAGAPLVHPPLGYTAQGHLASDLAPSDA